jgi:mannosyltransferase
MKITYDNIIFSLQKAGGISVYWTELLKRIKGSSEFDCYEMPNQNLFRDKIDVNCKRESSFFPVKILRYLPFLKILPAGSVFHSSYYRFSPWKKVINIVTVYDFTYEYFSSGPAKWLHSFQKKLSLKKASGIICISESTKKDLLRFYPDLNKTLIKTIYIGVGDQFFPIEKNQRIAELSQFDARLLPEKYILFVGDRSPYKNFEIAVNTAIQNSDLAFVVVGGKEFSSAELDKVKPLENRIFHFKGIDSSLLNLLYNNAFCLLYPSSYEGFGIPVVEAMKAGCPVIAVNCSSIPEVAGDAGLLVNELTADAFSSKIKQLSFPDFRKKIVDAGYSQSAKFPWDKCYKETMEFYIETKKMMTGL